MSLSQRSLVEPLLDEVIGEPSKNGADETGNQDGSSLTRGESVGLLEDVDDRSDEEAVGEQGGRDIRSSGIFLLETYSSQYHSPGESDPERQ